MFAALLVAAALSTAAAQDPAGGWLAYARALPPSGKPGQRLTFISARWKNNANPRPSNSFFSPWVRVCVQRLNPCPAERWPRTRSVFDRQPLSELRSRIARARTRALP